MTPRACLQSFEIFAGVAHAALRFEHQIDRALHLDFRFFDRLRQPGFVPRRATSNPFQFLSLSI